MEAQAGRNLECLVVADNGLFRAGGVDLEVHIAVDKQPERRGARSGVVALHHGEISVEPACVQEELAVHGVGKAEEFGVPVEEHIQPGGVLPEDELPVGHLEDIA